MEISHLSRSLSIPRSLSGVCPQTRHLCVFAVFYDFRAALHAVLDECVSFYHHIFISIFFTEHLDLLVNQMVHRPGVTI